MNYNKIKNSNYLSKSNKKKEIKWLRMPKNNDKLFKMSRENQ